MFLYNLKQLIESQPEQLEPVGRVLFERPYQRRQHDIFVEFRPAGDGDEMQALEVTKIWQQRRDYILFLPPSHIVNLN
jgi:hypothetical protein